MKALNIWTHEYQAYEIAVRKGIVEPEEDVFEDFCPLDLFDNYCNVLELDGDEYAFFYDEESETVFYEGGDNKEVERILIDFYKNREPHEKAFRSGTIEGDKIRCFSSWGYYYEYPVIAA